MSPAPYSVLRRPRGIPEPINFGNFHVGDTAPSQLLTIANTAAADGYSESLDAQFGSLTGEFTTNGA